MKKYGNKSSGSGVTAFEAGRDYIKIRFQEGSIYTYNHKIPGKKYVDKMKRLAHEGKGLSTYISQHVGDKYANKYQLDK